VHRRGPELHEDADVADLPLPSTDERGTGLTAAAFPMVLGGMLGGILCRCSSSESGAASSPSLPMRSSLPQGSPSSCRLGSGCCRGELPGERCRDRPLAVRDRRHHPRHDRADRS
jgi:hypothetical protein